MNQPTSWNEAREAARDAAKPLETVELPLAEALGTALASPIRAKAAIPSFDNSAMDGYAVAGTGPWKLIGRTHAGDACFAGRLRPGQAIEIATGAPVPPGAEAVLPVEHGLRDGDHVSGTIAAGKHIRRAGEDCARGLPLLPSGRSVTPAVLGLAASVGYDTLLVHRRPTVAVLVTGNELLLAGPPRPGHVRDSIGPLLPGLVRAAGARLRTTTHLADRPDELVDAMAGEDADVLVVCGATSKGPADHLRGALLELRADIAVHGVACRPGHPQLLAVLPSGRCVVGLPGNPYAALAAGLTLLEPLLAGFGGHATPPPATARLSGPVTPHPRDTLLVAVTRHGCEAVPVGHDRPGTLWGAALADALAVIPPEFSGGQVEVLPLRS